MKLEDIVEEISERSPIDITEKSIVRKVNNIQRELFRLVKEKTVSTWDLLEGQAGYPVSCPESNIILVNADGKDYPLLPIVYEKKCRYYTYMDSSIILHPVPEKSVAGGLTIYHYKTPQDLTTGDMEKEPDLDPDFQMLLVYGVLKDMEDQYAVKYDLLLKNYKRSRYSPAILEVKVGD